MGERVSPPLSLESPIDRLRQLGIECPPGTTLARFFEVLVDTGLVSASSAGEYTRCRQVQAFGRQGTVGDDCTAVAKRLVDEIEARRDDAELHTIIAERLAPCPPPDPAPQPETAGPESVEVEPTVESEPVDEAAVHTATSQRPIRRYASLAAAVVLWSMAMAAIGAWQHDAIYSAVVRFRIRVLRLPWLVPPEIRLARLRRRAAALPGVGSIWQDYATTAAAVGRYTEAYFAYRHLLASRPDDAETLNALAWLLCTAEDPEARDPLQGLALAEKAHALNPAPHITDTLAEAAFRTGDISRAVELGEAALAAAGPNDGYYRRQLDKFRAGPLETE